MILIVHWNLMSFTHTYRQKRMSVINFIAQR